MRFMPFFAACGMIALAAMPAHAIRTTPGCSKALPLEVSKEMLANYPDGWKKWEEPNAGYRLLVPPQLTKYDPVKDGLYMRAEWCGDAPKIGEPLKMGLKVYDSALYDKRHKAAPDRSRSSEYLSKLIFPNLPAHHTERDTYNCGGKQIARSSTTTQNGDLNFTKQVMVMPLEGKTLEFSFSYSISALEKDKANTDLFVHNNSELACNILQHAELTKASPAK